MLKTNVDNDIGGAVGKIRGEENFLDLRGGGIPRLTSSSGTMRELPVPEVAAIHSVTGRGLACGRCGVFITGPRCGVSIVRSRT